MHSISSYKNSQLQSDYALFLKTLQNRQKHTVPNTQFCNQDNRTVYYSLVSRQTLGLANHYRMSNDGNMFSCHFQWRWPNCLLLIDHRSWHIYQTSVLGMIVAVSFLLIHFSLIHFCLATMSGAKNPHSWLDFRNCIWSQKKNAPMGFHWNSTLTAFCIKTPI